MQIASTIFAQSVNLLNGLGILHGRLANASRRADLKAAGFPGGSPEVLQDTYGNHLPDYLQRAAAAIGQKGRYVRWLKQWST